MSAPFVSQTKPKPHQACVVLEWAGSGERIQASLPGDVANTLFSDFLEYSSDAQANRKKHAHRVLRLQKCIHQVLSKSNYCMPCIVPGILCVEKVRVFAGHAGPELTVMPGRLSGCYTQSIQALTRDEYFESVHAWKTAVTAYSASTQQSPTCLSNSQGEENSFVLAIGFYDDVSCAISYVTDSSHGTWSSYNIRQLPRELRHNEQVLIALLQKDSQHISSVAEACDSFAFRTSKEIFLASKECPLSLHYACPDLQQDTEFVKLMMLGNLNAIKYASENVICDEVMLDLILSEPRLTKSIMRTLLFRSTKLRHNKQVFVNVVQRWPQLFAWAAPELKDPDLLYLTLKACKIDMAKNLSEYSYDERALLDKALAYDFERFHESSQEDQEAQMKVIKKVLVTFGCWFREQISNWDPLDSSCLREYYNVEDVEASEVYVEHVHHHEIVRCTGCKVRCMICYQYIIEYVERFRCAAWCDWHACIECVENKMTK